MSMRGASLFFITIVMSTPKGRGAFSAYTSETITRFTVQSPYSYLTIVSMAGIALMLLIMMRQRRKEAPAMCIIRREIRGPVVSPGANRQRLIQRSIMAQPPRRGRFWRRTLAFLQRFSLMAVPVTNR